MTEPNTTTLPESALGRPATFRTSMIVAPQNTFEGNRILRAWCRNSLSHLINLEITQLDTLEDFRFSARGQRVGELLTVKLQCDSVTGVSGRNLDGDPIVVNVVSSGQLQFTREGVDYTVSPGQFCIRDTKIPWGFSCTPATHVHVVTFPRVVLASRIGSKKAIDGVRVGDSNSPEIRFLLNLLEAVEKSAHGVDFSAKVQAIALDACAALIDGIISKSLTSNLGSRDKTMIEAAKDAIEENLGDQELSPAMIARLLSVSPRTLHRTFSGSGESIMSFVRHRRLQMARDELLASKKEVSISEIATKWHFSDAGHFIRFFKKTFGSTPIAYLRKNSSWNS
ncbi:AraC family transcriptional regulator [Streptomyces hyaluromycini]|uniref:AraC family transcriptional regulator n=1 Tax=Streptomyces hyaluromycini TaxID=1377993 RepID=UPI001FEBC63D|nr:AraC family transcriptional regulator [Streptomyces hyaluromycini]